MTPEHLFSQCQRKYTARMAAEHNGKIHQPIHEVYMTPFPCLPLLGHLPSRFRPPLVFIVTLPDLWPQICAEYT